MNDLTITITGWAATDPTVRISAQGVDMCSFRLASTPRYYDREASQWTDGQTEWFTVRCFRAAAISVAASINKGQPVVVTGRLRTNEWTTSDGADRVDLQIDATALGHDLTRGIARFNRATVAERDTESAATEDEVADAESQVPDAEPDDSQLEKAGTAA